MKFVDWYAEFIQGKKEIAANGILPDPGIHSRQCFLCLKTQENWEIGRTYTGRLVIRSGSKAEGNGLIQWKAWQTLHDIDLN